LRHSPSLAKFCHKPDVRPLSTLGICCLTAHPLCRRLAQGYTIMLKTVVCCLMGLLLAAAPTAQAAELAREGGQALKAKGVARYLLSEKHGQYVVALVDASGGSVGEVRIGHEEGDTLIEYADNGGSQLAIRFAGDRGTVSITDHVSNLTGNGKFDLQAFRWVLDKQFVRLEQEKGPQIELAGAVFADVQESKKPRIPALLSRPTDSGGALDASPDRTRGQGGRCSTPTLGDNAATWVSCGGMHCRGFSRNASASQCCEDAAADAAFCCTNMECWGCCELGGCDFACAVGRYFCFCGVSGTSCMLAN
jgi:hypothetical protein